MKKYTTHIKSKTGWLDVDLKELYEYRDLIWLFFKRNYSTVYKQTILGPLWLILNPLISVCLYAFVFGNIAGLASENVPQFVFYLSSNAMWSFFAACLTDTANTFTANASIMGKVYFPRLVMPISSVLTGGLTLAIQVGMLFISIIAYSVAGYSFNISWTIMMAPLIVIQAGCLGLGVGIIIASLTTKYRDLVVLVSFGVQLWMYASPVVYSLDVIPITYRNIYMLNPMAAIIECWRSAVIGSGTYKWHEWGVSWVITLLILFIGVIIFSKIEKTFMDTV